MKLFNNTGIEYTLRDDLDITFRILSIETINDLIYVNYLRWSRLFKEWMNGTIHITFVERDWIEKNGEEYLQRIALSLL